MSIDDKKCIVEYDHCRLNGPFNRNTSGRCFYEAFFTPYQKLDCVFYNRGFAIHQSFISVTANLVGFLETIVLCTKSGYEGIMTGPINHEELKDIKNLYFKKWHVCTFIRFKFIT